jgi:hypothetical protein
MALGVHWEWRGFGQGSERLLEAIGGLEDLFPLQDVVDRYLWIPRLTVNVKLRSGVQDGLKFKRLLARARELELWHEDPDELYDFPLDSTAWERLASELRKVGLTLSGGPGQPTDLSATLDHLRTLDERIAVVEVHKTRQAWLWPGPPGTVKVEVATITSPEDVLSIGLENWGDEEEPEEASAGQAALSAAILELDLGAETLRLLSYLDATEIWARGQSVLR